MPAELPEIPLGTRQEWRQWLRENHDKSSGIWLVLYKKHTGKPCMSYADIVEECICFGWIDSIIKKLDEDRYARKITPRLDTSNWSEVNKKRVAKLAGTGLIEPPGQAKIDIAKANSQWNAADPLANLEMPAEFANALAESAEAEEFFAGLAPSYRKGYIGWIATAKRPETRERRIRQAIESLERGEKLGMK